MYIHTHTHVFTIGQKFAVRLKMWVCMVMDSDAHMKDYNCFLIKVMDNEVLTVSWIKAILPYLQIFLCNAWSCLSMALIMDCTDYSWQLFTNPQPHAELSCTKGPFKLVHCFSSSPRPGVPPPSHLSWAWHGLQPVSGQGPCHQPSPPPHSLLSQLHDAHLARSTFGSTALMISQIRNPPWFPFA